MTQLTLLAVCGSVLLLVGLTHCTDEQREKRLGDNDFFQATYNDAQARQRQRVLQSYLDDRMASVGKRDGLKRNFDEDVYHQEGLDNEFVRRLMAKYFDGVARRR
ncbi:uncharacterized protein LOC117305089 [Asterias rubens]|uniref:Pigment-dispersing factor-type n=1 Tax=Asterias rubens TaxID=7604 RepID=A0A0U2NCY2_ASTRU|nr:uncharacterized protein LOC117305089 [Asterias rubens]ALJ99951.1 pigment-dispersing factor-type precursor [Asterias rubens]